MRASKEYKRYVAANMLAATIVVKRTLSDFMFLVATRRGS